jgi:hypothetical protein
MAALAVTVCMSAVAQKAKPPQKEVPPELKRQGTEEKPPNTVAKPQTAGGANPAVASLAKSGNPWARVWACRLLEGPDHADVALVWKLLGDADPTVRSAAALAAAKAKEPQGLEPLVKMLDSRYPPERFAALYALTALRQDEAGKGKLTAAGGGVAAGSTAAELVTYILRPYAETEELPKCATEDSPEAPADLCLRAMCFAKHAAYGTIVYRNVPKGFATEDLNPEAEACGAQWKRLRPGLGSPTGAGERNEFLRNRVWPLRCVLNVLGESTLSASKTLLRASVQLLLAGDYDNAGAYQGVVQQLNASALAIILTEKMPLLILEDAANAHKAPR